MTRKDYEKIAKAFKEATEPVALVYLLMDVFEEDNPRFDRERFLTACGLR